ncbi:TetR family transcriptional regulator [uncultured Azohydromonas sp.]|jgi:hypothetical protein|uniref:TetR family transcriptional regulator n=1 Tax=uncultured Azohydromonas sp. TaxID=487342 RepID=UPI0026165B33|nr:TetR family transcriptional regulator [uncultured Azohydromonas sp.]
MKPPVTTARQAPQPAAHAPRQRNREKTLEELRFAMLRVKNKGLKMSIRAVALEAGVDPSLVHNTYPDIAEEIRALVGRSTRRQRDEVRADLVAARQRLREVTAEREQLKRELAVLASVNLTLNDQVAELKAEIEGKLKRIGPDPVV